MSNFQDSSADAALKAKISKRKRSPTTIGNLLPGSISKPRGGEVPYQ